VRRPKGVLNDGRKVTNALFRELLAGELPKIRALKGPELWATGKYEDAAWRFNEITTRDEYVEFLTLPAYEFITEPGLRVSAPQKAVA
jgi:malate synthase